MTERPSPLTDDDLSAAIDGEADAATVARIADDPAAQARQAELAAAADRLRTSGVAPLDPATIDDLVATALDVPVAPGASGRRAPAPWLVAAAVIALVAVGLGLIWSGRTGSQKSDSASQQTSAAGAGSAASPEASNKSADTGDLSAGGRSAPPTTTIPGHGTPTSTAPGASPSSVETIPLGSFATGADLRTALATSFPPSSAESSPFGTTTTSPATPSADAVSRCAAQLQVTLSLKGEPLHQGYATVGSKDVLVYEFASTSFADGTPTTLVAAVGAQACDQVVVFER